MTNTSRFPVTVDGHRLDTHAYRIETLGGMRSFPKQRITTYEIPGRDGLGVEFQDSLEEGRFIIKVWLVDVDEDGDIPLNRRAQYEANLDFFGNLIADMRGRTAVIDMTMGDASVRRTEGILTETVTPDVFSRYAARLAMAFMLPNTTWRDTASQDFSFTDAVSAGATTITTMTGSSAPIDDGRFLITGPINNPMLTDPHSGQWVQLAKNLGSGDAWLFDSGARVSRYGAGLTLASSNTAGTDGWPDTSYNGQYKLFTMRPYLSSGSRVVRLTLTGSSSTSATALAVRATRKFL